MNTESSESTRLKIIFVVTEDWYFCSHRLPLARAARNAGFEVVVVTREGDDGERIRSEGCTLIPLDMHRGEINPFKDVLSFLSLWKIFRRERPGIVHNVALKPVLFGTLAARLSSVGGIVNALGGLGYVFTARGWRAFVLRILTKLAFRLLFVSQSVRVVVQNSADQKVIENLGVLSDRIALIPGSGVDLSLFEPTIEPKGRVVVAMVSRMIWPKGVGDLVEASRILRRSGIDVEVLLIGGSDPANPMSIDEGTLKKWSKEGIISWLGRVPTAQIPAIWKKAHIGVLPSYYGEGVPKALLEAAASGKPLIATNIPGCRDVVVNEETGLLVPVKNPDALAEAIGRLAENASLRTHLGNAARARVEARFSLERVVDQTMTLYRSIQAVN